jgi:hypothetical protein
VTATLQLEGDGNEGVDVAVSADVRENDAHGGDYRLAGGGKEGLRDGVADGIRGETGSWSPTHARKDCAWMGHPKVQAVRRERRLPGLRTKTWGTRA